MEKVETVLEFTTRELRKVFDEIYPSCTLGWCPDNTFKTTIEHIWPLCRGGSNHLDNLIKTCSFCNSKKADIILSPNILKKLLYEAQKNKLLILKKLVKNKYKGIHVLNLYTYYYVIRFTKKGNLFLLESYPATTAS